MSDIKIRIAADIAEFEQKMLKAKIALLDLGKTGPIALTPLDTRLKGLTFPTKKIEDAGKSINILGSLAQKASAQIGNLAGSLLSGGLITGITVAGVALFELGKKLFDITEEQKRLNEVLEGAKSAYVKATIDVNNLRDAFGQAENGIIKKEVALKLYNSTLGKVLGTTKDFDEAEKNFIANAPKFIQYTLLKAAANIASGKAAEKAFEATRNAIQGSTKEGFFGLQNLASLLSGGGGLSDQYRAILRIADAKEEENDFTKIANSLNDQAKALGLDNVDVDNKETASIKNKTQARKEYIKVLNEIPKISYKLMELSPEKSATVTPTIIVKPKFEIKSDAAGIQNAFSMLSAEVIKNAETFAEMVAATIEGTMEDTFVGIGDSIGRALGGERNVVPNLFGSLMSSVGSQVQELGKFLIKSAITVKVAKEAFQKLLANPIAAVAVGIGLIALGALLKQQASKQFQGFASGVRNLQQGGVYDVGERGRERIFLPAGSSVQPNNELSAYGGGGNQVFIPAVTLSGQDLVISFNRASQSMSRIG